MVGRGLGFSKLRKDRNVYPIQARFCGILPLTQNKFMPEAFEKLGVSWVRVPNITRSDWSSHHYWLWSGYCQIMIDQADGASCPEGGRSVVLKLSPLHITYPGHHLGKPALRVELKSQDADDNLVTARQPVARRGRRRFGWLRLVNSNPSTLS